MIKSLRIRGWRSHDDSQFNFSDGTNVLIGVMGAGKSSILDAISFGLFGTFPSLQARKITLDDIIMNRPLKKDKMEVNISFLSEEDEYEVKRKVEKGKGTTESEIRKNGELMDTGSTRTTEIVEKILKVNYDLFSRAVYSEQNGLDYFLRLAKGQRMKKIDDLLQIDKFENARSSVTSIINRIKNSISDKSKLIEEMEESENFEKIDELGKEVSILKDEMNNFEETKEDLEKEKNKIESKLEEMSSKKKELDILEKQKNIVLGKISNLEEDLESSEIKDNINQVEKRKKDLEKELENKKNKLEKTLSRVEKKNEDIQRVKITIEDLVSRIERLKSIDGKCPLCDRKLTPEHREELIEERKEKIPKKEKELRNLINDLKKVKEEEEKIKSRVDDLKKNLFEVDDLIEKIKTEEEKRKKLEELKKNKKELEREVESKTKKLDEKKMDSLQKKLQDLSGKYSEVRSKIESNKKFIEDKNKQLDELKKKKNIFEKYKKDINKMKFLNEDLKKLERGLKETQVSLRGEFVEAVNITMDKIWSDLYPYNDYTSIRLFIESGDYILELKESGGKWVSVEGIASGGERTTAALALRIAFALVLSPSLRWLVLDEPTHNLDEQAKDFLSEVLREKIVEFIDQVFLITHDEKLENAVTGYLYRLERKKEKNEPTKVILLSSPTD